MMGTDLPGIVPELILAAGVLVLLPLGSFLPVRHRWIASAAAVVVLVSAGVASAALLRAGPRAVFEGTYAVDAFAISFKLLVIGASTLVLFASVSLFEGAPREGQVGALVVLCCLGMVGLAASQDLALVALFVQLVSVSSYILVGTQKDSHRAAEASLKLFLFSASAGAIMVYGMALLYGLTGTLSLPELGRHLARAPAGVVLVASALVLMGLGFKATLVPFHGWAPDTYQGAPTPLAGFLAVGPKAAALGVLARMFVVVLEARGWQPWLGGVAAVTMTFGNLLALRQTSLKRLLAYSSIAQAGYLLVGIVAAGSRDLGLPGMLLYLAVYVFMNLAAFLAVDAIERRAGSDDLDRLAGMGRHMPLAALTLTLGILSLAGIPPLGGFAGKTLLLGAALDAGMVWLALVMAVNFALSLVYYARVLEVLYLHPGGAPPAMIETPTGLRAALVATSVATLASGILPAMVVDFARRGATLLGRG
jgi:NADH-quinone oxidoreductase subunit N